MLLQRELRCVFSGIQSDSSTVSSQNELYEEMALEALCKEVRQGCKARARHFSRKLSTSIILGGMNFALCRSIC